jgi:SAM-dependent methyltransferase
MVYGHHVGSIEVFGGNPRLWGEDRDGIDKSLSGPGSDLERTVRLRRKLAEIVVEHRVESIVDAPCGDLFWMSHFLAEHPGISYVGFDAMAASVEAARRRIVGLGLANARVEHADLASTILPRADLVLERDGLQHLPDREALRVLGRFVESGARLLVATVNLTDPHRHNEEIEIGGYRPINLLMPPFSLPPPLAIHPEQLGDEFIDDQKYFGIWDLDAVRRFYEVHPAPWRGELPKPASRLRRALRWRLRRLLRA